MIKKKYKLTDELKVNPAVPSKQVQQNQGFEEAKEEENSKENTFENGTLLRTVNLIKEIIPQLIAESK